MAKKRKIKKGLNRLVQAMTRFMQKLTSEETYRILRTALVTSKKRGQAGFVLPTTTLLILVMLLVVSALMFRSYQRSTEVIGEYQLQAVENPAAAAIERAKSKLEYLLSDKGVYGQTAGVPPETLMESLLLTDNIYLFDDETAIPPQVNIDGTPTEAAWSFQTDGNGDGDTTDPEDLTTAYTIVLRSTRPAGSGFKTVDPKLAADQPTIYQLFNDNEKADNLVVNNGPLVQTRDTSNSCNPRVEYIQGWFPVSTAVLMKSFQVFAVSVPNAVTNGGSSANPVISTVQYQQDRTINTANKWGAWFRNDIEFNPGRDLIWNGAIHSEGSIFVRPEGNTFSSHLISAPPSCFYKPELNSKITARGHFVNNLLWANSGAFTGTTQVYTYDNTTTGITLTEDNDSIDNSFITGGNAINIALDPLRIQIANESVPRGGGTFSAMTDANWQGSDLSQRIEVALSSASPPPYVDDTYRADDLYGPKPGYDNNSQPPYTTTPDCPIGMEIDDPLCGITPPLTNNDLLRNETVPTAPDAYGLDGYWERRARAEGLRVIVGQRLELGNAFGWSGEDPLHPPDPSISITNLARQRRTQWDNLAAVQATAVYHYDHGTSKGYQPVAVVATTVHPGTAETLQDSATFDNIQFQTVDNTQFNAVAPDFFNGRGTNGWEFEPPELNASVWKALANLAYFAGDPNGAYPPLQAAGRVHPYPQLTMWGDFSNLRRIIESGNQTPPSSGNAGDMSLADATTVHTAAAMLGMLAYNIDYLESYDYAGNQTSGLYGTSGAGLQTLADELWELQNEVDDPANDDYEVIALDGAGKLVNDGISGTLAGNPPDPDDYKLPPEAYISKLQQKVENGDLAQEVVELARFVMTKEQVKRDRIYGFRPTDENASENAAVFTFEPKQINNASVFHNRNFRISCDVTNNSGNNYFGLANFEDPVAPANSPLKAAGTNLDEQDLIGLSRLCSNDPKFPALYYVFPVVNHGHAGANNTATGGVNHLQPAEPYIADTYIQGINTGTSLYQEITNTDLNNIALQPRPITFGSWILPTQSAPAGITGSNPNRNDVDLVAVQDGSATTLRRVAIKDSAFFDPREEMSVRALNMDVDILRNNSPNSDTWLPGLGNSDVDPNRGAVYVFREDAVREDAIARPPTTNYTSYESAWSPDGTVSSGSVLMDANRPADPPVFNVGTGGSPDNNADRGISPKAVDYYADPDRRPYGFRLKNGADLRRNSNNDVLQGITLVSDNPVYIQGDFNVHTEEEFLNNSGDFYDRTNINPNFGDPNGDSWRPSEILADAVSTLSANFCDGSIEDGLVPVDASAIQTVDPGNIRTGNLNERIEYLRSPASSSDLRDTIQVRYGCPNIPNNRPYTSYLNQNRPRTALGTDVRWLRANPAENDSTFSGPVSSSSPNPIIVSSPIVFSRNGAPMTINTSATPPTSNPTAYNNNYYQFNAIPWSSNANRDGRQLVPAANGTTEINAVIVSGVVPSRNAQQNGGIPTYPRMIENWSGQTLKIRGSFMQLNFSNYATGPLERDAWEPRAISGAPDMPHCSGVNPCNPVSGTNLTGGNNLNLLFYLAPTRDWGYDVALQYLPAGPVSRRFVMPDSTRSEFYREPKADNDYICKLRDAIGFSCP
ncbi:hormogonium polysaccharide biosynthesis protein HpsA [Phormidium sp. CCY1219]|uniref:hormogonium polysaccharide biosynthesis protein HpsA n=1 Tax=Phormidium sp. CCY1219 TaxID=2886104 RepID=UPI002D1EA19F|nr:hormogonium polysaccharide biosynthesis protein HpsA [Phormidium sp. CCY1219]MEB3831289.1 hormogonium polysaccharide biosynthesis protein HpsA [Phormidium sp. CCY1219]